PHCGTSSAIHARCTACARFLDRPSIVVTRLFATAETGSTHVRVAVPSRCTVHAPQWAMPQPNLVPVRPSVSRSTQRSGVSGATSTDSRLPLTVKEIGGMTNFPQQGNGEQRAQASREREGGMPASSCAETVRPIPQFLLQRRLGDCAGNERAGGISPRLFRCSETGCGDPPSKRNVGAIPNAVKNGGAGGRIRTGKGLRPETWRVSAFTSFATPAPRRLRTLAIPNA